ncbi:MAG TPA: cobalamin B12-binding domain-containing protein [Gaiellaceae bacterium]|nr:cobalamin B12-binding domain-containing protein [Gaiellaceae bacterium]
MSTVDGYLRIGELSRRTGVSVELLRAWEKRYGLLDPARSGGGFRLYSDADVERVQSMQRHIGEGLAAAEAARRALAPTAPPPETDGGLVAAGRRELAEALARFDEARAHAVFDRLLASVSLDTLLAEVVIPYLHDLGEEWERGEATVAQEHFASSLVRGRLLGLARGWGAGAGPHALLACPPGELHDLALIAFGLALRARGWRITYLGQDTPLEAVADEARALKPQAVVLALTRPEAIEAGARELARLARELPVWLAGPGASDAAAAQAHARLLGGDPVAGAELVATA